GIESETEVNVQRVRLRCPFARRRSGDGAEVDAYKLRALIRRAFGLRQCEQLTGEATGAHGRAVHALDFAAHVSRQIAPQQELEMHLQSRERCPQLVRRVGKK